MAAIANKRDLILQSTVPRLLKIPSNYLTVVANSNIFTSGTEGINPTSIDVLALFSGMLAGTVNWSVVPNIPTQIEGNKLTIFGSDIAKGTSVEVTATLNFLGEQYSSTTLITHVPDAQTYKLLASSTTVVNEGGGVFVPSQVEFLARTGLGGELTAYSGRFTIEASTNGISYVTIYTSSSNEQSYIYTPNHTHKLLRVRLYQAGGTTVLLDQLVVTIATTGETDLSGVLFASAANILTGVIEPEDSGALKTGPISWNPTTGQLTGGTGVAMTKWGLIGASNGVPTFTVESSTGNAAFGGSLNAATGTFAGNLSAAGGTFSGNLSAAGGTFTGTLSGVNGTFSGTLQAGSIITNSVTISGTSVTMQQLVDSMDSTFDLQGALNSGVQSILAGVGGSYRLHVDNTNALITIRHQNAVYNGTAASGGGIRPALGISAAGIAMGYNNNAGTWINAISLDATGNALFAGTIAANSIIANSVTISGSGTTMQQLVDSMDSTFDLQGALTTGVGTILAGVGGNYRLHVDNTNALITIRHQNAVYNGTATSGGGIRPALGISAAGIAMGYNNNAGTWINAISLDATGNALFAGTIAANSIIVNSATVDGVTLGTIRSNAATGASHVSATGNVHNVALSQISGDLGDIANGSGFVKTTANQATGGERAFVALDSSNDYVRSLVSTKLTVVGSNPSTGWVGDANGIRLYQGGVLRTNLPVSGNPTFSGDITGGANIHITGSAIFRGQTSFDGGLFTLVANPTGLNRGGISGRSGNSVDAGVRGYNGANGIAVDGFAFGGSLSVGVRGTSLNTGGYGVEGVNNASGGIGVRAVSNNGTALQVHGNSTFSNNITVWGNSTFDNNLTISGTTIINGMTKVGTGMVTNLNAQLLGGRTVLQMCYVMTTQSGTATASGGGFNFASQVSGTSTTGSGNQVRIVSVSDERLKQKIEPEILGLDFIRKLKPVSYYYKDKQRDHIKYHGFIYQDVRSDLAELLYEDDSLCRVLDNGIGSVDYMSLIAPIVKAIQQIDERITKLEEKYEN